MAVAALSMAGASRLDFEPSPSPADEHVVVVNGGRVEQIAQGYRNSARVERVEVRGTRVIVKPKQPARDVRFARALLEEGSIIEARALKDLPSPLPTIAHEGGYAAAVEEAARFRRELLITGLVSFLGVLLLFAIAFRRVEYALLTIAFGLAMTLGVAAMAPLTASSAGIVAILIGIGGAWTIAFYGRYAAERSRGDTTPHALIVAVRAAIPPIVLGAVVMTAAFLFLHPLTAAGIVLMALSVMFLLPSLIVLSERNARRAPARPRRTFVFAALALIVAFASLWLSHFPALRPMGYASALGIALVGLAILLSIRKGGDEQGTRTHDPAFRH